MTQTRKTTEAVPVEVVIEIPRGSFLKRGSSGRLDFVSPLPCPFNYGSVHAYLGLDDDYLDAVVLGPRLAPGSRVTVTAVGAIGLVDRGIYDDKLICSSDTVSPNKMALIQGFFVIYALAKRLLNIWRQRPGPTYCAGWSDASAAIARSRPCRGVSPAPRVPF